MLGQKFISILMFAIGRAQDFGPPGSWELVAAVGSGPQATRWHSAATTGGCLYVTGGAGAAGNATFQYDTSVQTWSQLPSLPSGFLAPATVAYGGVLLLVGGESGFGATDSLQLLSTTNSSGGWADVSIAGSTFGARNGHKVISFGGMLYLFGGWNGATYFNDLYGLDLNSLLLSTPQSNGQPASWVQLLSNGAVGMVSPRNSFSWDVYGHVCVMFGGIWANGPTNPSSRVLYNDVWLWSPGAVTSLSPFPNGLPSGWTSVPASGMNGGPTPSCRYGHTSGMYGHTLFVFGGTSWDGCGTGPSPQQMNDLWAFSIPLGLWGRVPATSPWPSPRGVPAGLFVGRHLYISGGASTGSGSDLWRWAPALVLPTPAPVPSWDSPVHPGVVFGLVAANLIGLATLAIGARLLYGKQGAGHVDVAGVGAAYTSLSM